jgi:hypothetical protein
MANKDDTPGQQGPRDSNSPANPNEERLRGLGDDDVRGIADDEDDEFEDTDDEDDDEEKEGEGAV